MFAQIVLDSKKLLHSKPLMIAMLFLSLCLLIPAFDKQGVFEGNDVNHQFDIQLYRDRLSFLLSLKGTDYYNTRTAPQIAYWNQQIDALADILRANSSNDAAARITSIIRYERFLLDEAEAGYNTETPPIILRQRIALLEAHLLLGIYNVYDTRFAEPAFNYAASVYSNMPTIVLMLPAIIVYIELFSSEQEGNSRSYESVVPLADMKIIITHIIVSICFSIIVVLITFIPSFIYVSHKNGLGSLEYPYVYVVEGTISVSNLADYYVKAIMLLCACNALTGTTVAYLSRFYDSQLGNLAICVVQLLIGVYTDLFFPNMPEALCLYNPWRYYVTSKVIGYPYPRLNLAEQGFLKDFIKITSQKTVSLPYYHVAILTTILLSIIMLVLTNTSIKIKRKRKY